MGGSTRMGDQEQDGTVGIEQLPPDQLNQIKKQLEAEVEEFTKSIISLKYALGKYEESNESLAAITPENEGKKMLVPLTNSLYVPGSLGSPGNRAGRHRHRVPGRKAAREGTRILSAEEGVLH